MVLLLSTAGGRGGEEAAWHLQFAVAAAIAAAAFDAAVLAVMTGLPARTLFR